jgi:hypothetical protein
MAETEHSVIASLLGVITCILCANFPTPEKMLGMGYPDVPHLFLLYI